MRECDILDRVRQYVERHGPRSTVAARLLSLAGDEIQRQREGLLVLLGSGGVTQEGRQQVAALLGLAETAEGGR